MTWETVQLGDFLTLKRGYDLPASQREYGSVPVVSSSGITGYHSKAMVEGPGVVTGRYGTLGEVFYLEKDFWPLNTSLYVQDFKGNRPKFVAYFLRHLLKGLSSAKDAVPGVNRNDLHARRVVVTKDLRIQDSIACTLSYYDDLIENNRRRIELLEQAARLLYKEWFVHFRFPGHEHVKIVDGVPEGWKDGSAVDAMDILSGGTPKTTQADYWGGEIPFFTPKDSTDSLYAMATEKTITDKGLQSCNSKLYSKDTVFITARGTVGKVNLAQVPMAMNQSCYALVAKAPVNQYYLYFALVEGVHKFKSQASGAVFDAIVRDTFKRIPFFVPNSALIEQFTFLVEPVIKQVENLTIQNQKLKVARDLLLPRLMNGEIAI